MTSLVIVDTVECSTRLDSVKNNIPIWKKLWGVASEDVGSRDAAVKPPGIHGDPHSPCPKADAANTTGSYFVRNP
jgi:hypothetical protein